MMYILILVIHLGGGNYEYIPHTVTNSLDECNKLGIMYENDLRDGVVTYECEPAIDE